MVFSINWYVCFFVLKCLSAELNLDQDAIEQMAVDINNAIVGVPDVDQILADTGDDVMIDNNVDNDDDNDVDDDNWLRWWSLQSEM